MELDKWYKAADFTDVLDLKERRIKVLLNDLVDTGLLIEEGSTKGKKWSKA